MKRSKLSKDKQLKLIEHFAAGTAARTASVLVKVNKTTASYYFLRLRELIFEYEKEKEEEAEELAYKIPVFGLLKRGGKVYIKIINNTKINAYY